MQKGSAYYNFSFERLQGEFLSNERQGYISPLENFWRFAAKRLYDYSGTEQKFFLIFLKEMEFRFNNRSENIYDAITSKLG